MTPATLFYIIIGILVLDFVIDQCIDYLNARHFNDAIPGILRDIYSDEKSSNPRPTKKQIIIFPGYRPLFPCCLPWPFFFWTVLPMSTV